MQENRHRIGWVGMGRMGYPMAERLAKGGHAGGLGNRTRAKAEPLAAYGARIVERPSDLAAVDILFTMVSTGRDLEEVYFGDDGVIDGGRGPVPRILVDCSSIGGDQSEALRGRLEEKGAQFLAAPVSG